MLPSSLATLVTLPAVAVAKGLFLLRLLPILENAAAGGAVSRFVLGEAW